MNIFKKVIIFGLTFLGTLAGLDVYLQLAEIQTPMETRIDPQLGPTYIPNKLITRFNEGFFMGSANAFGYMGPAVPPRRRGTERRILLLGDSFVLGHTVLPRHYFGRYLEEYLDRATREEVHALNFGKADFNFGNMYQYYQDFAGKFDHDLALFFVGEGDLIPTGQAVSKLYPTAGLQGDAIVIDKNFRSSKTYRFYKAIEPLFTRLAVLRLVFNTYKIIHSGSWIVVVLDRFAPSYGASDEEPAPSIPQEPKELPELSRAILRELAKDSRNVLVIQTKLAPELLAEVRASGLPLIDLEAYLESLQAEGRDPYYWPVTRMKGHWNHASQPLIGKFLAEQIIAGKLF
jgi:hypothetical protein